MLDTAQTEDGAGTIRQVPGQPAQPGLEREGTIRAPPPAPQQWTYNRAGHLDVDNLRTDNGTGATKSHHCRNAHHRRDHAPRPAPQATRPAGRPPVDHGSVPRYDRIEAAPNGWYRSRGGGMTYSLPAKRGSHPHTRPSRPIVSHDQVATPTTPRQRNIDHSPARSVQVASRPGIEANPGRMGPSACPFGTERPVQQFQRWLAELDQ